MSRLLASPVEIEGETGSVVETNQIVQSDNGSLCAQPTGQTERIEAGLVLRSIGYVGTPLAGRALLIMRSCGFSTRTGLSAPTVTCRGWGCGRGGGVRV